MSNYTSLTRVGTACDFWIDPVLLEVKAVNGRCPGSNSSSIVEPACSPQYPQLPALWLVQIRSWKYLINKWMNECDEVYESIYWFLAQRAQKAYLCQWLEKREKGEEGRGGSDGVLFRDGTSTEEKGAELAGKMHWVAASPVSLSLPKPWPREGQRPQSAPQRFGKAHIKENKCCLAYLFLSFLPPSHLPFPPSFFSFPSIFFLVWKTSHFITPFKHYV